MTSTPSMPKAIVICGPTGVGKTSFAIELARHFQGEIVGADSMQVYRHMDIGSAKPTRDERTTVRHHMVDVVDPDEPFDAEVYAKQAFSIVASLWQDRVAPFVVGGTGLYIRSLVHGLFDAQPVDPVIRSGLRRQAAEEGPGGLYARLLKVDPASARKLHVNDTYRIVRALEVYESSGVPISDFRREHRFRERRLRTLKLGLHMERRRLYERIDKRVDKMIDEGLLAEVRRLLAAGYTGQLKPMQSIGYRHMLDFVERGMQWPEAVRLFKRDTRRYAKRQMTWFGADEELVWLEPQDTGRAKEAILKFLSYP